MRIGESPASREAAGRPEGEADRAKIKRQLTELGGLNDTELQSRWQNLYGSPAPTGLDSMLMRLAVAYRIQELALGGLSVAAREQLTALAAEARDRVDPPLLVQDAKSAKDHVPGTLTPGMQLLREWNGVTAVVDVLANGFAWRGRTYSSLSAVALAITGTKWSGPRFFGLRGKEPVAPTDAATLTIAIRRDLSR